jgi:hypothetical protein
MNMTLLCTRAWNHNGFEAHFYGGSNTRKKKIIFVLGMKHAILTKRQILIRLSQMGENLVE